MEFEGMETSVVEVLRARELQRLRRIRQLGLVHMVFPGAEHSRLVHSLGAAHLALRFGRHLREATEGFVPQFLRPSPSAIRDFALAALFHDLGHGPLSHVWEREVVGDDFDRSRWCAKLGLDYTPVLADLKWHELVGQALLAWEGGQLHQILEQQESGTSERLRYMLLKRYYIGYLPRLLAGDVDVDRCDFVLRDAHQSGVAYGRYDVSWLISTATVGIDARGELAVGFDERKAPRVVEQLLIARRALYETVYYHKTVRSAEGMIGLLFRRLKEVTREEGWPLSQNEFLQPFQKAIEGEPLTPEEILGLDDHALWVMLQGLATIGDRDVTVADLAARIVNRDLFKMIPCSKERLQDFLVGSEAHERLKNAVRPFCPGLEEYYLLFDRTRFSMLSTRESEEAYLVNSDDWERPASRLRDQRSLPSDWRDDITDLRLFAPREAVESLMGVLGTS